MSSAGNGYLSSNLLIPYPFKDGEFLAWNDGINVNEAQMALQKCFVEAAINLQASYVDDGVYPSIGQFLISDQGATLSFVLTACREDVHLSVSASKKPFPIVSGNAKFGSYTLILSSEGIREFCDKKTDFPPPATASSSPSWRERGYWIELCPKCVTMQPETLSSIRVYNGVDPKENGPHFILSDDIVIKPGNNMLFSEPNELGTSISGSGNGVTTGVKLNATPGAGLGVIPCTCVDEEETTSPFIASDGHSRFFNDTCYDIEPRIIDVNGEKVGHLQFHVKCTACCQCTMYESIVNERLAPLANLVRSAKSDLDDLLDVYEDAVERFNHRIKVPTKDDISISLSGMPVGSNLGSNLSNTEIAGKMNRCSFTSILRNSSYVPIQATIYTLKGSDSVVVASATWTDADGNPKAETVNSGESLIGKTFDIYQGRSLFILYISKRNDYVSNPATNGYKGAISIGVSYKNEAGESISVGIFKKEVEV